MLPARFHGLGLPNFVVVAFAKKVFYVQCHWGAIDAPGYMLQWAYENVVVEVGLYGDPFDWDYECFNSLATEGTWVKNLWQLSQLLGVKIELDEQYHIRPVRVGDCSLISEFSRMGFLGKDLEALKVVANHKCAVHLSDIVCCDGRTIDRGMLTTEKGNSEGHRFPREKAHTL